MALSDHSARILVEVLATGDAAWMPVRNWGHGAPHVFAARRAAGVSRTSSQRGRDEASRKRDYRASEELVDAGLLRRDPKMYVVALTPAGIRRARALAWPHYRSDLAEAARRLAERTAAGDCMTSRSPGWTPECLIAGWRWGEGDEWIFHSLSSLLLPLLISKTVESCTTTRGHCFYRKVAPITDESLAELIDADAEGDFDESLGNLYLDRRELVRSRLEAETARMNELGGLPMALHELRSKRDYGDLSNITLMRPFAEASRDAN